MDLFAGLQQSGMASDVNFCTALIRACDKGDKADACEALDSACEKGGQEAHTAEQSAERPLQQEGNKVEKDMEVAMDFALISACEEGLPPEVSPEAGEKGQVEKAMAPFAELQQSACEKGKTEDAELQQRGCEDKLWWKAAAPPQKSISEPEQAGFEQKVQQNLCQPEQALEEQQLQMNISEPEQSVQELKVQENMSEPEQPRSALVVPARASTTFSTGATLQNRSEPEQEVEVQNVQTNISEPEQAGEEQKVQKNMSEDKLCWKPAVPPVVGDQCRKMQHQKLMLGQGMPPVYTLSDGRGKLASTNASDEVVISACEKGQVEKAIVLETKKSGKGCGSPGADAVEGTKIGKQLGAVASEAGDMQLTGATEKKMGKHDWQDADSEAGHRRKMLGLLLGTKSEVSWKPPELELKKKAAEVEAEAAKKGVDGPEALLGFLRSNDFGDLGRETVELIESLMLAK